MKSTKPKISFDPTPQRPSVDQPFDREAWEKQLNEPKVAKAPLRRVVVETIGLLRLKVPQVCWCLTVCRLDRSR